MKRGQGEEKELYFFFNLISDSASSSTGGGSLDINAWKDSGDFYGLCNYWD